MRGQQPPDPVRVREGPARKLWRARCWHGPARHGRGRRRAAEPAHGQDRDGQRGAGAKAAARHEQHADHPLSGKPAAGRRQAARRSRHDGHLPGAEHAAQRPALLAAGPGHGGCQVRQQADRRPVPQAARALPPGADQRTDRHGRPPGAGHLPEPARHARHDARQARKPAHAGQREGGPGPRGRAQPGPRAGGDRSPGRAAQPQGPGVPDQQHRHAGAGFHTGRKQWGAAARPGPGTRAQVHRQRHQRDRLVRHGRLAPGAGLRQGHALHRQGAGRRAAGQDRGCHPRACAGAGDDPAIHQAHAQPEGGADRHRPDAAHRHRAGAKVRGRGPHLQRRDGRLEGLCPGRRQPAGRVRAAGGHAVQLRERSRRDEGAWRHDVGARQPERRRHDHRADAAARRRGRAQPEPRRRAGAAAPALRRRGGRAGGGDAGVVRHAHGGPVAHRPHDPAAGRGHARGRDAAGRRGPGQGHLQGLAHGPGPRRHAARPGADSADRPREDR